MVKGTPSMGKKSKGKTHIRCRRCGRRAYHVRKKKCASCGYPNKRMRTYSWKKEK
ncbi:50S ribosomal protein L37e [Candidatus Woesearchaeota archaeon]|nr:MAG: 50S ribosomal protein L37e [Candidatus Woesearchaeota archaeon]RLE44612.1 MAG: 50S ribosomal protein L37e [Candidatus Woesearchaeota archaeon]